MTLQNATGCSVTQRIKQMKQPRGGYVNPKMFAETSLGAGADALNPEENIHASLVGLAVDYLTRFMSGTPAEEAFAISLMGAKLINEDAKAAQLVSGVKDLNTRSIVNAVKLSGFDVVYRAGIMGYRPVDDIAPDASTVENIRIMVERSLDFLRSYGPKTLDGFTFEGGYTATVVTGDGDFVTADTLWDFKVSKTTIKKEHTLQLLMYWRMGLHSLHPEFQTVEYLGVYNPRTNTVHRIAVSDIPAEVIAEVETEVIGYDR